MADVALYTELHPTMVSLNQTAAERSSSEAICQSRMSREDYYAVPAVTRYYNHVQHLQPVTEARTLLRDTPYLLVEFDLENMPPIERKMETKEKKSKKDSPKTSGSVEPKVVKASEGAKLETSEGKETEAAPVAPADSGKKAKKEKKEKAPQVVDNKKAKAPAEPTSPVPSMIDLRVGKVLEGEGYRKVRLCSTIKSADVHAYDSLATPRR
jgi:aminoacyl tRNA synthase complex-interacting multifunctional protein 1